MGCLHVIRARARVVFVCARVGGNPTILLILMLLLLLLLLLHYCCSYCCCSYYCCSYYLFDVIVCDPRASAGLLPLLLLPPLYLHNDCHQITFRGAGKEPRSTPTMVKPRRNCCSGAGCRVTLREDNSAGAPLPFSLSSLFAVVIQELPEVVRHWVVKTLQCDVDKRFCFDCVRNTAPSWGFPRKEKSAISKKRGLCAFNGFECEFDGRSDLFPFPRTVQGFAVKSEVMSAFGIPPYAPERCLCATHKMKISREIQGKTTAAPIDLTPQPKRPRRSASSSQPPSADSLARNLMENIPKLTPRDRNTVLTACTGERGSYSSVARVLQMDYRRFSRRSAKRALMVATGYTVWRRRRRGDAISERFGKEMEEFWMTHPDVRPSECGRMVTLRDSDAMQTVTHARHYATKTYHDLWLDWQTKYGESISYSSFCANRPFWLRPQPQHPRCV